MAKGIFDFSVPIQLFPLGRYFNIIWWLGLLMSCLVVGLLDFLIVWLFFSVAEIIFQINYLKIKIKIKKYQNKTFKK